MAAKQSRNFVLTGWSVRCRCFRFGLDGGDCVVDLVDMD